MDRNKIINSVIPIIMAFLVITIGALILHQMHNIPSSEWSISIPSWVMPVALCVALAFGFLFYGLFIFHR